MYKLRQINESEDEERQDLSADYEDDGYISLPLLKVSNRPINLGEKRRNLTYLISIKSKRYQVKYQHSL